MIAYVYNIWTDEFFVSQSDSFSGYLDVVRVYTNLALSIRCRYFWVRASWILEEILSLGRFFTWFIIRPINQRLFCFFGLFNFSARRRQPCEFSYNAFVGTLGLFDPNESVASHIISSIFQPRFQPPEFLYKKINWCLCSHTGSVWPSRFHLFL